MGPPRGRGLRSSLARFSADGIGLVLGTISSIVTARLLGPSSKGTLAALVFVTALATQGTLMGLGDAVVVWVGRGKATLAAAVASSLSALLLSSAAGAVIVLLYSVLQLPLGHRWVGEAVIVACATVGVASVGQFLIYVAYAMHQIVTASAIIVLMATVTTAGVVLFCAGLRFDVLGGVLAGFSGASVGLLAGVGVLRRAGISLRLGMEAAYLRPALHYGLRTQLANVLAYSSARVDLLLVYALVTGAQAGLYSVALTVGTLTGFVAIALSFATFPRMAQMPDREALRLTAELARTAAVIGVPFAAFICALVSTALPWLLGSAYAGSVAPAVILLFGNLLWGEQWLLSRALAARGDPTVLFRSFATNLSAMVLVDLALIPLFGIIGAAIGSVLAPAAGVMFCLRAYRQRGVQARDFVPRPADVKRSLEQVRASLRMVRGDGPPS